MNGEKQELNDMSVNVSRQSRKRNERNQKASGQIKADERNACNQNEAALREAPFGALILKLCVPTVIIMVVMVLYNMADVFFIGQTGSAEMIAAVSLCGPVFSILSGLGTLFGSGGCTAISLALGRGDIKQIRHISALCFYGSLVIGSVFLIAICVFLNPVVGLIGADASTFEYTKEYVRIIALFGPVILFSNVFMNLIRADGAAKESLIANLTGTVTNIILDPVMILGLGWGVTGAAAATVLGNLVSAGYLFLYVQRKCPAFSMKLSDVSLRKETIVPVVTLGLPLAASTILMSISQVFANNMLMAYGASAVAAQGVAGKISMLISMTAMGICMGMQPALSYNYAAGARERLGMIVRNTGLLTVGTAGVLSLGCFVLRDQLLSAFIANAEVLAVGRFMIAAAAVAGPVYGLYQLGSTYLQATGRAALATFVSLLDKFLIFLPLLWTLHGLFGMNGIICTAPAADSLSAVIACAICLQVSRRERDGRSRKLSLWQKMA